MREKLFVAVVVIILSGLIFWFVRGNLDKITAKAIEQPVVLRLEEAKLDREISLIDSRLDSLEQLLTGDQEIHAYNQALVEKDSLLARLQKLCDLRSRRNLNK